MSLGRTTMAWTGKHLVALALIAIILAYGLLARDKIGGWVSSQLEDSRELPEKQAAYSVALQKLDRTAEDLNGERVTRQAEFKKAASELRRMPANQLRQRLGAIDPAIAQHKKARLSTGNLRWAILRGDTEKVSEHYRAGLEARLLEREKKFISDLLSAQLKFEQDRLRSRTIEQQLKTAQRVLETSDDEWRLVKAKAKKLRRPEFGDMRNYACSKSPFDVGCETYRSTLLQYDKDAIAAFKRNIGAQNRIKRLRAQQRALRKANVILADASDVFEEQRDAVKGQRDLLVKNAAVLAKAAASNWPLRVKGWLQKPVKMLGEAFLILAAAILSPILIKCFFYFVVAPFASRRLPIRILPEEAGRVSSANPTSAVSQRVSLDQDHELLVLPEFLQSSPHEASKGTKWLLSWWMPLSSLASGMVGLTRIRSGREDYATISATNDPLAEIGMVNIPSGSAMVLQPRSLVGVLQPIKQKLLITRHWRLDHLSAWLTFQFRFLVFHGPCSLIVQGTRGVRLEKARTGRGINQAATMGFSAGLAYSIRRCETFGAYLMGKQGLFNDSFAVTGGAGQYLYEEMPREGKKSGIWGRGLEGLSDATLKVFGL